VDEIGGCCDSPDLTNNSFRNVFKKMKLKFLRFTGVASSQVSYFKVIT